MYFPTVFSLFSPSIRSVLKLEISFDVIFRMQIHRLSHILHIHFITYTAMLLFSFLPKYDLYNEWQSTDEKSALRKRL